MKKSNLMAGIIYLLAGFAFLLAALGIDGGLGGILFGLAGAGIGPGVMMVCKYVYWSSPKNRERYRERQERERIELHDELNVKLRDRSGRYAYLLGLMAVSLSMVVFSVLGSLGAVDGSRTVVLYLGGYLVFQLAAGVVIFNHLRKKY